MSLWLIQSYLSYSRVIEGVLYTIFYNLKLLVIKKLTKTFGWKRPSIEYLSTVVQYVELIEDLRKA